MTKEEVIWRVYRNLKLAGFITEGKEEHVKWHLNLVWTAGYEFYRKTEITHNRRKIELYTLDGKKLADYPSIAAAAKAYGCRRDAIDTCLNGRSKRTKRGHIWKYAEDGNDSDINTGGES